MAAPAGTSTNSPKAVAVEFGDGTVRAVPEHIARPLAFLLDNADRLLPDYLDVRLVRQNGRWRPTISVSYPEL